ncbi:uncharacterized protein LOC113281633 [Papaver somniferum]|uniref:uncharacterized protein LOC113281633 n=1 Tax=Papaver somniferum TaxID=3469 RepID=UPI000E701884|nr:uncharacterized protein LOC113281633 [Papaver somniferum]
MLCLAHTIWIGNTVAVATSIDLIGNHLFGVWNGDRRISSSQDTHLNSESTDAAKASCYRFEERPAILTSRLHTREKQMNYWQRRWWSRWLWRKWGRHTYRQQ